MSQRSHLNAVNTNIYIGGYSKLLRHKDDQPITFYNTFCCWVARLRKRKEETGLFYIYIY